jgi:uncharacterized protein YjbI with pentapeptide repeats/beta-lactamase regulating signal transducer with metallopeptidase domain
MLEAVVSVALRAILASVVLSGALAALVFLATRLLALTAATRHALWTTALVAIAVMPLAGIGVSVLKGVGFEGAPPQAARPPSVAWGPRTELAKNNPVSHGGSALAPSPSHHQQTKNAAAQPVVTAPLTPPSFFGGVSERLGAMRWTPRISREIAFGVVVIWALGALIGLAGLAASIARVRGLKRRSSPLDGALADELPWLTAVGPGREIYLRLSYETETPVAVGFRRPVILIPTELATGDGLAAIEQLILHEYAHLRRNDDWTNLVQRTIERVFWFNPVVWLVGRRIALEREIASDDAVVEKTGEAHAYAASLWKLAREMRMPEHAVVAPGALLTRKQISVRIEQLLDANRARLHRSPIAALGVALASIAAVAFVATSAPAVELPSDAAVTVAAAASMPRMAIALPAKAELPPPTAVRFILNQVAGPTPIVRERIVKVYAAPSGEIAHVGREIGRAVHDAMAALPSEVAQETTGAPRRARTEGLRLSRDLVASCLGCSFRNADAHGLDLHGLRINGDDFGGADLHGANLSGASLLGVSLARANLANADLRGAQLNGVELGGAILDGAQLDNVRLTGVSIRQVSLRGVSLRSVLSNCTGCDFHGLDLHGQDLHGIALNGADLSHANLRDANLSGVRFNGVDLTNANLRGADLANARLDGCDLSGIDLRGARTSGMTMHGSSLGD